MSNFRQTVIASPPAAMLLALVVAILTAPVLMLSRVQAAPTPPTSLPCTVANANGCTELSPIPPEDTAAVPPNIVLMLDDSGSMDWDFMPDWNYLALNSSGVQISGWNSSNDGVRNPGINSIYYNPAYHATVTDGPAGYQPPPKADGSSYPASPGLTNAYKDGFLNLSAQNITNYTGGSADVSTFPYFTTLPATPIDQGPATPVTTTTTSCPSGWTLTAPNLCTRKPTDPPTTTTWKCNPGDVGPTSHDGNAHMCRRGSGETAVWYPATSTTTTGPCPAGSTGPDANGKCNWPNTTPTTTTTTTYKCPSGSSANADHECMTARNVNVFTYALGAPGRYVEHYVAPGTGCDILSNPAKQAYCVNEGDTTNKVFPDGTRAAPVGITPGQNVANWFSYYRTRLLMSKTGMMFAFSALKPKWRLGFGSINANGVANIPASPVAPYGFDDSMSDGSGGSINNKLASVQPFGDGSAGTQKALFWKWLAGETANGQTPLRKALDSVGKYYQTSQPWSNMPGDPGYTDGSATTFACRASYAILTTDGFWNGDNPATAGLAGAASNPGPVNSVPSGDTYTQYLAQAPLFGGGAASGPSLADVATYYWETDLQPDMPNEVAWSKDDPAAWQHMTTFTVGLGFPPTGLTPSTATKTQIQAWAANGSDAAIPGWPMPPASGWPTPASNSVNNIADLMHAGINGRGDFFNVTDPTQLAEFFAKLFGTIDARTIEPTTAALNASVLSLGALTLNTGYETRYWSGTLQAVELNSDGTFDPSDVKWDARANLSEFNSAGGALKRSVYTDAYVSTATPAFSVFKFSASNQAKFDVTETAGLGGASDCTGSGDTICNRINYLLGDPTYEGDGALYRARTDGLLGAILRSQPVYVARPGANYYNTWPVFDSASPPPENATGVQTYDAFVTQEASRAGTVYVGANDGMLHAFDAPVPECSYTGTPPVPSCNYNPDGSAGNERWAFIPRAVYANLGNLTTLTKFQFLPTVDATPVTRDVFFSEGSGSGNNKWHTMLVGGVGLGGRGVYALDITDPTAWSASYPVSSYPASGVLWEFDSDMANLATGCVSIVGSGTSGTCQPSDLGFSVPQPNIGRVKYQNKWVVLVSNGYFPDCQASDTPTLTAASCQAIAAQVPTDASGNPYSALFVLDAQTGKMIAELKTPTTISGVPIKSFGLSSPVLGDYQNDQVDDVAFAGDVQGNLWRFDLSGATPSDWTVTLVYKGGTSVDPVTGATTVQSITSMPRLFPDPTTNRFMVVFGTGRFLGVGDNSDNTTQSAYGVRDELGKTWTQGDLTPQYLHEEVAPALLPDGTPNPLAGASLRCVTGGASDTCDSPTPVAAVPASSGGWYINLYTTTSDGTRNDAGERVVATPSAIFASNTAVIGTLITGSLNTDACSPLTEGAVLALNAISGQSAGVSALGSSGYLAGARVKDAPTSGALPIASALGGGRAFLPGMTLAPSGASVFSVDAPIWRRRSWSEINQNQ